jgi:hypothetical protein
MDALAVDRDAEMRRFFRDGLGRLSPSGRVAFLRRMCVLCPGPLRPAVTSHTGTVGEAHHDLMMLGLAHGLDLGRAARELEALLRRG